MRPVLTLRLAGGALLVLATLVVVLAWLTPDYSFVDHPVDLLALGRMGWVLGAGQVLTGLLLVLAAPTAGRALDPERARRAVPVLLALTGAGLAALCKRRSERRPRRCFMHYRSNEDDEPNRSR